LASSKLSAPGASLAAEADAMRPTRRALLRTLATGSAALVAPAACTTRVHPWTLSGRRLELVVGPGGWCWFQSPRAVIDGEGQLWLGSTQGTGAPAPGSVDVTQVDLATSSVVGRTSIGRARVDDHTSPSVSLVDGQIQVGWAAHARTDWLELGELGEPLRRIHRPESLVPPGRGMSYVSAHVVGRERWVLTRGEGFTWHLLTSVDGQRWEARGAVIAPTASGQRPYVLAASDGARLHLVVSDGNPTEVRGCGVGVAVVDADRTIRRPDGVALGRVGDPPTTDRLHRLLDGVVGPSEADDVDAWMCDLVVAHRRPTALLTERTPWPTDRPATGRWSHRYLWARQRASGAWSVEPVGWAGRELYGNQPDYCGLGAIDPRDPTRIVVSTDVHPRTGEPLRSAADGRVHHELFEGRREGPGSWGWTPITTDSIEDNLRPVLAASAEWSVLAWMRGTYRSWTDFDAQLVLRIA
jgi:hypothetical protein